MACRAGAQLPAGTSCINSGARETTEGRYNHCRSRYLDKRAPNMPRLLLTPFLAILVALLACSGPTQVPDTTAPAQTPAPSSTPMPEATPVPTEAPTERPTAAPRATPASSPKPAAPADTTTQTPMSVPMDQAPTGAIAPLSLNDPEAALAELSEHEQDCLRKADDTGNPVRALGAAGRAAMGEQAKLISCLEDETVGRIFLAGFVGDSGPLSQETSACVRTVFRVIDPRRVMTAGLDGNPQAAMAGSMAALSVTIACLTDEEWTANRTKNWDEAAGTGSYAMPHGNTGRAQGNGNGDEGNPGGTLHRSYQRRGGLWPGHGTTTRADAHRPFTNADTHTDFGSLTYTRQPSAFRGTRHPRSDGRPSHQDE